MLHKTQLWNIFQMLLVRHWLFFMLICCRLDVFSGFQTVMPAQPPSYQCMMGVQQTQNQSLVGSQARMANQIQSMMVQYPTMPPYQVSECCISYASWCFGVFQWFWWGDVCVCQVSMQQGSQSVPQAAYQQQILLQGQTNQTPAPSTSMQVYYSMMPPTQHSSIR